MQIMRQQEVYISEDVWWPHGFQKAQKKEIKERHDWNLGLSGLWSDFKLTERMGGYSVNAM